MEINSHDLVSTLIEREHRVEFLLDLTFRSFNTLIFFIIFRFWRIILNWKLNLNILSVLKYVSEKLRLLLIFFTLIFGTISLFLYFFSGKIIESLSVAAEFVHLFLIFHKVIISVKEILDLYPLVIVKIVLSHTNKLLFFFKNFLFLLFIGIFLFFFIILVSSIRSLSIILNGDFNFHCFVHIEIFLSMEPICYATRVK